MKPMDILIYLSVYKVSKIAIENVLCDKLEKQALRDFLGRVWRSFRERAGKIKWQKTVGATIMTRLALLTLIVYEALLTKCVEEEALELTSKINWIIYSRLANRFWIFTRLFSNRPIVRVKRVMQFFIGCFPYNAPGYEMELLKTGNEAVVFNVKRCPAAEFFDSKDLSKLCIESWCNLDYPLAEKWNVKLERDKTIAGGSEYCNFRFVES